jgi:hypothetical protein
MTAAGVDGRLERYLLGHLSPDEEERVEVEYLAGEEAFALVQEAEHDLIDDYVAGHLSADDARRFEVRLLPRPEMAERVAFARALQAGRAPARRRAVPHWLASAAAAVLAVVSTGLAAGLVREERASAQAREAAQSRIGDLERALAAQRARIEAPPPAPARTPSPVFELRGGTSRGPGGGVNEVEAPPAGWVPLRLLLDGHLYPSYEATLETAAGQVLARPPVVRIEAPAAAEIMVPAALLKKGAYVVVLYGVDGRSPEEVEGFTFQVRAPRSR